MTYTEPDFQRLLDKYGELHVTSAAGEEYHIHRHDTEVSNGYVKIDSKLGDWTFPLEGCDVEFPHSHKE